MGRPERRLRRLRQRQRQRQRPAWTQEVWFAPDPVDSHKAVLAAARMAGCTCAAEVYVSDSTQQVQIFHDAWCPLLRRGEVN